MRRLRIVEIRADRPARARVGRCVWQPPQPAEAKIFWLPAAGSPAAASSPSVSGALRRLRRRRGLLPRPPVSAAPSPPAASSLHRPARSLQPQPPACSLLAEDLDDRQHAHNERDGDRKEGAHPARGKIRVSLRYDGPAGEAEDDETRTRDREDDLVRGDGASLRYWLQWAAPGSTPCPPWLSSLPSCSRRSGSARWPALSRGGRRSRSVRSGFASPADFLVGT